MKCKDPDHFRSDDMTAMDAEMIEIDENLCRAELTTAQRSAAIKRRREIWAAMHPEGIEAEQVVPPQSKSPMARPQETGFAAETSAAAGMTKQAINRHLARADALGDDLEAVVGTSLDKGVELDALAKRGPRNPRSYSRSTPNQRPLQLCSVPHTLCWARCWVRL